MPGDRRAEAPATRHRLDRHHFNELAAGLGAPDTISHLLAVERSWRLVQFRAVLDAIRRQPEVTGPLPSVETAWDLLVEAQRRAASAVDDLLLHPQAGTWAGYTLRRLRGSATASTPLWVDVGYLHALAAVAAVRAGIDFRIAVPVRDGYAALPTMGAAYLPAEVAWDHAEVHHAGGRITVRTAAGEVSVRPQAAGTQTGGAASTSGERPTDGEPSAHRPRWVPLPTVRVGDGEAVLKVNLDTLDPYRNLRTPSAARPLADVEVAHWRALLEQAWRLLVEVCPQFAAPMTRGLFSVVPQRPAERFRTMSASAGDAFGSMIISELRDAVELAVTMVHEFQHIKLGGLLHLTPLQEGEPAQRLYAPWRDDPRPLSGLLQGVYAFVGITEFWRAARHALTGPAGEVAQFEFARWRREVTDTLRTLRALPQLTDVGRRLLAGLAAVVAGWQGEEVPAGLLAAADAAVAGHRARWRLHHLRPDEETVTALAAAWLADDSPPDQPYPESTVRTDPDARALDAWAVLTLWRITDPAGFADLRRTPEAIGERVTGATAADLAAVAGDLERARDDYLAEVVAGSAGPAGWAGLAVTLGSSDETAAEVLRERPELVREVHRRVSRSAGAAADPVALAAWIGGKPTR